MQAKRAIVRGLVRVYNPVWAPINSANLRGPYKTYGQSFCKSFQPVFAHSSKAYRGRLVLIVGKKARKEGLDHHFPTRKVGCMSSRREKRDI